MLRNIMKYLRFIKFSHTIFALPFALIGFFLAVEQYGFRWDIFVYIILCMVFARSAAMGFNRFLDKDIDAKNPRTADREIPKGEIDARSAIIFVIINSLLFICCTYLINELVFYLSFVALAVVLGYSYTKRFTPLSHLILGLGLSLAPIGAYLSVSGRFSLLPILFSVIVLFWVSGFDIIYSLMDYDFDKENNLKSIPVLLGKKGALIFSFLLHFFAAVIVIYIGVFFHFSVVYWIGGLLFIVLLFYQHSIVRADDLSRVNFAFFNLNGYASVLYAIFTIWEVLR